MGALKQLLPLGESTIIGQAVDNLLRSGIEELVVVLGHEAAKIRASLAGRGLKVAVNPEYQLGMSSSVAAGARLVKPGHAVMIALADQPFIGAEMVDRLVEEFRVSERGIVIPSYLGKNGHPVLFAPRYREALSGLNADFVVRDLIRRNSQDVALIPVDCAGVVIDIDTAADYRQVRLN